ncbi:Phosphoesterase PA-phosphatase related protein [Pseudodesulfovibrio profundus]|uniref:Phosphoesterase PA-phosphatase related protein n=1 Tax=Pseudodesulfovibrio profundus TaxID=57320 RepID=A0A2C8F592_9BACT|nr:phosphatase PAP2 family protein [Pseudodesulfovibrio profundus]SOB57559.1 Phosphoesterase PA-phosphatase related protein [Pseudodesulfovibrio profundus]
MIFQTPALDHTLLVLINQKLRALPLDIFMPIISSQSVLFGVGALLLLLTWYFKGRRQALLFLILVLGLGVTDATSNHIKKSVKRVRPLNAIPLTHFQEDGEWRQRPADFVQTKEAGSSYPSAHSANTMCLAILTMFLWPGLKKWPLLLPLVVGYSRVYLGKHYPTDVLAGWLYGVVTGVAVWLLWRYGLSRLMRCDR